MNANKRKSVRANLRFLCYLLFKNTKAQSIEQKETEIARPGKSAQDISVYSRALAVQNPTGQFLFREQKNAGLL